MHNPHMSPHTWNFLLWSAMLALSGVTGCSVESPATAPVPSPVASDGTAAPQPAASSLPHPTASAPAPPLVRNKAPAKAWPDNPRIAKFAELDADHDGQLSIIEFRASREAKEASKWFGRRDANHDGSISLAEFVPKSAPAPLLKQPEQKPVDKGLIPDKSQMPDKPAAK